MEFGCPRGDASFTLSFSLGFNPKFLTHTRVVQTRDCPPGHRLQFGIYSIFSLGIYTGENGGFVPILPWQTLAKVIIPSEGFPCFVKGYLHREGLSTEALGNCFSPCCCSSWALIIPHLLLTGHLFA